MKLPQSEKRYAVGGVRAVIFTSCYANPELGSCKYTAVRISLGLLRWKLGYEIAGAIDELMSNGIFGIEDYDEFHRRYF